MNILEAGDLGYVGDNITQLLSEIRDASIYNKGFNDNGFEDEEHRQEYILDTIEMIRKNLTKLKMK